MDYKRLIGLAKASGYKGYTGIEFEGNTQPEEEGIRRTKALLEKYLSKGGAVGQAPPYRLSARSPDQ